MESCIYCGGQRELTNDHVPPKNLFPKPRPSNLITVPACTLCHSSTSKDDEYFRLKLCMSENVGDHPDADINRETILRSLNREQATGLKQSFFADIRKVQRKTNSGLYLRDTLAFNVDLERIFRVVIRTTRGLYYYEVGKRLNPNYDVDVHSDDTLINEPADVLENLEKNIIVPLFQKSPKVLGNDIFMYRYHITDEDPNFTVWALTFYGRVSFLVFTGPHERYIETN